ncbi:winged helix-turn-helix transcriptional regulator [Frondihabitans australicus]|uniref:HxlR family transcriptional regulator n=1 Tax=Frondihabitans australicus TaxID=386892 RepID=A0A495IM57_9MICO|nr:helix-turn-helix domain-containing protein [Frondihabitans australicus]RKR76508.1 HxlR family transcriptional regulator [Frondihabitans australicus]
MPLGTDYATQHCAISRTLEVVGERWTLLIVRDLFYGIRRYSDMKKHIGLPPATLTSRLNGLVEEGLVERVPAASGRDEYALTEKGASLWPIVSSLAQWGSENYVDADCRMSYTHRGCGPIGRTGACENCGMFPAASRIDVQRGDGVTEDVFAQALRREPHPLMEPLRV